MTLNPFGNPITPPSAENVLSRFQFALFGISAQSKHTAKSTLAIVPIFPIWRLCHGIQVRKLEAVFILHTSIFAGPIEAMWIDEVFWVEISMHLSRIVGYNREGEAFVLREIVPVVLVKWESVNICHRVQVLVQHSSKSVTFLIVVILIHSGRVYWMKRDHGCAPIMVPERNEFWLVIVEHREDISDP